MRVCAVSGLKGVKTFAGLFLQLNIVCLYLRHKPGFVHRSYATFAWVQICGIGLKTRHLGLRGMSFSVYQQANLIILLRRSIRSAA